MVAMPDDARGKGSADDAKLAARLHAVTIHLLRRLRVEDTAAGLSPARLSALSVLVFGGPRSVGALARAEQVRPPTMTRLVSSLEAGGLVEKHRDPLDGRVVRVQATAAGARVLEEGRARRVAHLSALLDRLHDADRDVVARATTVLEHLTRASREEPTPRTR
jgi:DNA-binding MarR family transcriptional regulator